MLKIRLKRVGRKHQPVYRLVVAEHTTGPKSGKQVEILGSYDPRFDKVQLNAGRIKYWLGVGAKPSPTAHNILVGQKIIDGRKINVLPRKSPIPKDGQQTATAPVAASGLAVAPSGQPAGGKPAAEHEDKKEDGGGHITNDAKRAAEMTKDAAAA